MTAAGSPETRPNSGEEQFPLPQYGRRLREARQQAGLTQAELASKVGVSKGFVSQLENNNSQVSVANLVRICGIVGLDVGSLFESSNVGSLVRHTDRTPINLGGHGVTDHLLSPPDTRGFKFVDAVLEPRAYSGDEHYSFEYDIESVHVRSGQFEIELAGERSLLNAGDTMTFEGRTPRSWRNPSIENSTHVIWVLIRFP